MAKATAISNEEIIAALLQHGTVKEAAAAAGTTPRTIYDRMQDREFQGLYWGAKNDVLRSALTKMNSRLSEAVDAIAGIMNDTGANPAVRLQAAQVLLKNAAEFAARLQEGERVCRDWLRPPYSDLFD